VAGGDTATAWTLPLVVATYILGIVALVLLVAAAARGLRGPQARTWLLGAGIFTAISLWLFSKG
jgi:EamA domain-containing membrane protein RarD